MQTGLNKQTITSGIIHKACENDWEFRQVSAAQFVLILDLEITT